MRNLLTKIVRETYRINHMHAEAKILFELNVFLNWGVISFCRLLLCAQILILRDS